MTSSNRVDDPALRAELKRLEQTVATLAEELRAQRSAHRRSRASRWLAIMLVGVGGVASAQLIPFNANTPAKATEVNANFNQLKTWLDTTVGMIAMFNTACPTGWTRFTALDGRYPKGAAAYGATGGNLTHNHAIKNGPWGTANEAFPGGYLSLTVGGIDGKDEGLPTDIATELGSSEPPFREVVWCRKNAY